MGLVDNQICSLRNRGEHANPAKLFEMVGFSVSPTVNPMPACIPCRIRDSSAISKVSPAHLLSDAKLMLARFCEELRDYRILRCRAPSL